MGSICFDCELLPTPLHLFDLTLELLGLTLNVLQLTRGLWSALGSDADSLASYVGSSAAVAAPLLPDCELGGGLFCRVANGEAHLKVAEGWRNAHSKSRS